MIPWFKNVIPHKDIKDGNLDESVFAANLADVAAGRGPAVYTDAKAFFTKTYFTSGIKTICKRVVKGLAGDTDAGDRSISLQTGFGGGKTHSLITLYHIAKQGQKLNKADGTKELLKETGEIKFKSANVAVFTNTTCDPVQGRKVGKLTIRTLWGELAYQLGGEEAYDLIKQNDQDRISPKGVFRSVLEKCQPAMILIDELADYCSAAAGVMVGKTTLADQTISFMQELSEAVTSTSNCVLVATLPASAQEVASSENGATILNALSQRMTRVSADTQPVSDEEIFEVIRRRLFESTGKDEVIDKVVMDYTMHYETLRTEIPTYAIKTEYKEKLRKSYPFHPELIEMFHIRWASNNDFQRTRGVLRLLASIVNDLWQRQHSLTGSVSMIHTSDVHFSNLDALSSQLKKLYGNGYDAVISADVSGTGSNAFRIDDDVKEYGSHNLTQGIAATILLGSFGSISGNKGLSREDIKLCVVRPDSFNHNSINGALDRLEGVAHYLYYSTTGVTSKRYWFHTQPNINILVNQAKSDVDTSDVHNEIIRRLNTKRNSINRFEALVAPGNDLPEQQHKPALIIMHPKYQAQGSDTPSSLASVIREIATKKGYAERIYRNTMLFLVCSELGYTRLQKDVTDYLACTAIKEQYQSQLEKDQKDDLSKKLEQASQAVDRSIANAYNVVYKHVAAQDNLPRLDIKQFKDNIDAQVNVNVFDALKSEEWLLESVGIGLLRKNNLIPSIDKPIKVKDVYEAFLRYDDKPVITGKSAVQDSLVRYCYEGEFAIASGEQGAFTKVYYKEKPAYFEVTEGNYWLVDRSLYKPVEPTTANEPGDTTTTDNTTTENTVPLPKPEPAAGTKAFKGVKVSGKVDVSNYSQVFTSFINPLINNDVEIFIEIRAKAKSSVPINENTNNYKIPKESAKQLGLNFEEEV